MNRIWVGGLCRVVPRTSHEAQDSPANPRFR